MEAGYLFEIEPEGLCELELEAATLWWEDLGKELDLSTWGGVKKSLDGIEELAELREQLEIHDDDEPYSEKEWHMFMKSMVEGGWGIYDSNTRTIFWKPGTAEFARFATIGELRDALIGSAHSISDSPNRVTVGKEELNAVLRRLDFPPKVSTIFKFLDDLLERLRLMRRVDSHKSDIQAFTKAWIYRTSEMLKQLRKEQEYRKEE